MTVASTDWCNLFKYDENSPTFLTWIGSRSPRIVNYKTPAGRLSLRSNGTKHSARVQIIDKLYLVHRIIWEMFNGPIPSGMVIDHLDGDPWNNDIRNLRVTTQRINTQNSRLRSNNSSGTVGVSWELRGGITYAYAFASLTEKEISKHFSTKKYGLLPAFKHAWVWRKSQIESLNNNGQCYTERHGTLE